MARDDSVLYGGSSSASFGTTHSEKQRKDIVEDKKEKRGQHTKEQAKAGQQE